MTELDRRIYRAAARAAAQTGVPILTHLAIDAEPAIAIFSEEGLPLDRVLFGHADDGVNSPKTRDPWIAEQGGRVGFDTFGYETELARPAVLGAAPQGAAGPLPALPGAATSDKVLAGVDANCSPLGLAGREGPHRQLPLRGPDPRPARGRGRRGDDHQALRRVPRRLPDHPA